ncbi:hypothetical protein CALCODRAFT_521001 [Calocera cornea HHB12733]|uniref:MARVEL domain-containing protein n=1 Tax=Calocera cornea HHB12733 TaxID=1353952 RepID=A0A165D3D0_9BASI|nr:hypothetical protein CALCODRAFT_521001 [Calocera cornea HHB12733]
MANSVFATARRCVYVVLFALAAVELGIAANLTNLFLSTHHDFFIYSLVPSSYTILVILGLLAKSRPAIDLVLILIADILWLALGAYSQDVLGSVQCDALGGQTIRTSMGGTYSSQSYCYQMKAIEAVAWAEFGLFLITFFVILAVSLTVAARGQDVWAMDIDDLEWFGAYGGAGYAPPGGAYQYGQYGNYPQYYANGGGGTLAQGNYYGQPVVVQQPGRNILVQQGPNGPNVQELPASGGVAMGTTSSRSRR